MLSDPHALLPVAYRAAARVLRSRLMAEEAGERALHLLTLATLAGRPPQQPEAWLRVVARRSACALLRSEWARTQSLGQEELQAHQAPYRAPRQHLGDYVREHLEAALSPRQRDAMDAALHCNGTRAAARRCGMQPRDFRRYLGAISRKARSALPARDDDDAFADDPTVQFRLGS
jgi:DNA-directed RNA polymerase specialized sigma24 family protein